MRTECVSGCCYGDDELSLSANQTSVEATGYLYDSDLRANAALAANVREQQTLDWVYGAKLSPDGALFFQPAVSGIDVFDGRAGTLRTRIALPFALSTNFDALVSNGRDNNLLALVDGGGIAIINLNALPEPQPLTYQSPASRASGLIWQPDMASTMKKRSTATHGGSAPRRVPRATNPKFAIPAAGVGNSPSPSITSSFAAVPLGY